MDHRYCRGGGTPGHRERWERVEHTGISTRRTLPKDVGWENKRGWISWVFVTSGAQRLEVQRSPGLAELDWRTLPHSTKGGSPTSPGQTAWTTIALVAQGETVHALWSTSGGGDIASPCTRSWQASFPPLPVSTVQRHLQRAANQDTDCLASLLQIPHPCTLAWLPF